MAGERTFMSEKRSIDLTAGDFLRIPVSVAHDDRGIEDVYLLSYVPTAVAECVPPMRTTEYKMPPFQGWQPKPAVTDADRVPGCYWM